METLTIMSLPFAIVTSFKACKPRFTCQLCRQNVSDNFLDCVIFSDGGRVETSLKKLNVFCAICITNFINLSYFDALQLWVFLN